MCSKAAMLLLLVAALACATTSVRADGWQQGRATHYGDEPWYWSIHHGSCGKGYLWPDQGTGWDVVALSDRHPDYSNSCGTCYEVKCEDGSFKDGYGSWLDRKGVCKDSSASVVVTVTDTCPCVYSNNFYSNKRWCCGDMNHFDLSVWAFQKLTDMKWGVVGIKYRKVACDHKPAKWASGATFPGEFPPKYKAGERSNHFYYKHFPQGGYLSAKNGDGSSKVSVSDYLRMAGKEGSAAAGK